MKVGLIIDISVILIAIVLVIRHTITGFFNSLFGLLRAAIAGVLAYFLKKPLGRLLCNLFMDNTMKGSVRESLIKSASGENDSFFNYVNIHKNASFFYDNLLVKYGLRTEGLDEQFENITSADEATIEDMSNNIGSAFSFLISSLIAFIVIFILANVILWVIFKFLNKATKLPGINVLNKVLGALLGLFWAVVITTVIGSVIVILNMYFPDKVALSIVNDSIVLRIFYNMGLLKIIPNMI